MRQVQLSEANVVRECINCGFRFFEGKIIPQRNVHHPNAYYNPGGIGGITRTPYVQEVCPKCGSDAIKAKVT